LCVHLIALDCTRTRFFASDLQFVSSEWYGTRNLYPSYSIRVRRCIKSVLYLALATWQHRLFSPDKSTPLLYLLIAKVSETKAMIITFRGAYGVSVHDGQITVSNTYYRNYTVITIDAITFR